MRSSFMQFCSETTYPSGARYCAISIVAHSVSYDLTATIAMSIGFSLASCCVSVRCFLLGHAFESEPVPTDRLDMFRPGVDQGDVEPVMGELAAGIAADGAGPDDHDA